MAATLPPNTLPDLLDHDVLLTLLTPAIPPSKLDLLTSSEWSKDYLTRLTSMSLDSLSNEPALLSEEQTKIRSELKDLAFREYPSFIHANECRLEVHDTMDQLSSHLATFTRTVPSLESACHDFTAQAALLTQDRARVSTVLDSHQALLDILEIPPLMETCVRNGYYAEAMDLAAHVQRLQLRHPTIPLIAQIADQVRAASELMLTQLVTLLRRPIKLPAAMNVVGYLRRMEAFENEVELRMVFLKCRDDYLRGLVDALKKESLNGFNSKVIDRGGVEAFEYLKKYIDLQREQLFDIITQYWSIFSEDHVSSASAYSLPLPFSSSSSASSSTFSNSTAAVTILPDYIVHLLTSFRQTLATHLPQITDISYLSSLLTQLMYCGMSLGRVGLDFRHLVTTYFETSVESIILRLLDAAERDAVSRLVNAKNKHEPPSTWMAVKITTSTTPVSTLSSSSLTVTPPTLLMDYPPLATLANDLLSLFNALRLLAPASLLPVIRARLEQAHDAIAVALNAYAADALAHVEAVARRKATPAAMMESESERSIVSAFVAAYARCLVPFVRRALVEGVFGGVGVGIGVEEGAETDLEVRLGEWLPVVVVAQPTVEVEMEAEGEAVEVGVEGEAEAEGQTEIEVVEIQEREEEEEVRKAEPETHAAVGNFSVEEVILEDEAEPAPTAEPEGGDDLVVETVEIVEERESDDDGVRWIGGD
ncbi:Dor1-like family-domain-containing protein [Jimgerdemannia flammicorona]|uniref:Conserved oligomeric Golgi complex subunit 8 n=1 Tax=Jimgerdemannia flammicorona TaxID=994334 RepID=A0A433DIT0_9FUNG|nr:Dor1-like family-domain-containing protein [Jimgerdemannia flammicorona]